MRLDDFLDPVSRALLFPPAESARALDAVDLGAVPPLGAAAAYLPSAIGAAAAILREPFRPPRERFVAFPDEGGALDVLRVRWRAEGRNLEMAQTRYGLALWTPAPASESGATLAQAAAQSLLNTPPGFQVAQWGVEGAYAFGGPDPATTETDGEGDPDWRRALVWLTGEGRVAFATVKATGGPTREVISLAPDDNANWF